MYHSLWKVYQRAFRNSSKIIWAKDLIIKPFTEHYIIPQKSSEAILGFQCQLCKPWEQKYLE